jgi:hypothetical protein
MDLLVVIYGVAKRGYIDLTCAVTRNVSGLFLRTGAR